MVDPVYVEARPNRHIFVRFADGTEGVVDVSALSGQGVFRAWDEDARLFAQVYISDYASIAWHDRLDFNPARVYQVLTGSDPWQDMPLRPLA